MHRKLSLNKFTSISQVIEALRDKVPIKALSLGMMSQVVSSATNFGIAICLVRTMSKAEFGLYGLGFAAIMVFSAFLASPVGLQFVVNVPDKIPEYHRTYAVHHVYLVAACSFILIAIGLIIKLCLGEINIEGKNFVTLIMPVVIATTGFNIRDVLMRIAYSERRETVVLLSTISVGFGVAAGYGSLFCIDSRLDASTALLVYGSGQFIGFIVGSLLLRLRWVKISWKVVKEATKDIWAGGRWNILTSAVYNLKAQSHNFIIALLLGTSVLAEVNAARILIVPATMAIPPMSQVFVPRLAARRHIGAPSVFRAATFATIGLLAIVIIYVVSLLILLPRILPIVLGPGYINAGPYVFGWCAVALLLALRNGLMMALEALRAFPQIFLANFLSGVVAVIAVYWGAKLFCGGGAIFALAFAEAILCFLLLMLWSKGVYSKPTPSLRM